MSLDLRPYWVLGGRPFWMILTVEIHVFMTPYLTHVIFPFPALLETTVTSWPFCCNSRLKAEPRNPVPPPTIKTKSNKWVYTNLKASSILHIAFKPLPWHKVTVTAWASAGHRIQVARAKGIKMSAVKMNSIADRWLNVESLKMIRRQSLYPGPLTNSGFDEETPLGFACSTLMHCPNLLFLWYHTQIQN